MNNLIIVNLNSEDAICSSQLVDKETLCEYIIGCNGYSPIGINGSVQQIIIDTLHPEPIGWFANALFTLALNRPNIEFLSYVDSEIKEDEIDGQILALQNNPNSIAAGRKAVFIPDFVKTSQYLNPEDKREWCISTPWTMRLQTFMALTKNQIAFNQIANGINQTFQDEVHFEYLFAAIFMTTQKMINQPILLVA